MSAILAIICGVLIIAGDQLTKYLVTVLMEQNQVITVIPGILNLTALSLIAEPLLEFLRVKPGF